jgi:hypothetical protein
MADPITLAVVGATIGAASNEDDPIKGALQGAAIGGLGGAGLGAMSGAGAAAGAAEGAGLLGAEAAGLGAAEGLLGAGIDASLGSAYQAAGMGAPMAYPIPGIGVPEIAMMPDQFYAGEMMDAAMGASMGTPPSLTGDYFAANTGQAMPALNGDLSWMDNVSKSQMEAIGTGRLPGSGPRFNPMSALQSMNSGKQQEQPAIRGGGVTRGDPRAVQKDAVLNLLAPKRLEKRKISLLG